MTNFLSLIVWAIGYLTGNHIAYYAGLFAFSGALTNWLAIHMLFEKVPGLYGSGIIALNFESFKTSIKSLMMEQFFTNANLDRFLNQELSSDKNFDLQPVLANVDFNPTFDSLVDVIANSSFGGMLAMVGGAEALQPLKAPFVEKMEASVLEISQSDKVQQAIKNQITSPEILGELSQKVETIIDQRLNELTPQLVKEMVQKMIKQHLGWLIIWGGVFGGLIGVISAWLA